MGSCSTSSQRYTRAVWTKGSASSGNFVAFLRTRVEKWRRMRATVIVEAATSAGFTGTAAVRYANEEEDLATATATTFGATQTNNGATYPTVWTDLSDDYQIAEIGVEGKNVAGYSNDESAIVTIVLDFQA